MTILINFKLSKSTKHKTLTPGKWNFSIHYFGQFRDHHSVVIRYTGQLTMLFVKALLPLLTNTHSTGNKYQITIKLIKVKCCERNTISKPLDLINAITESQLTTSSDIRRLPRVPQSKDLLQQRLTARIDTYAIVLLNYI